MKSHNKIGPSLTRQAPVLRNIDGARAFNLSEKTPEYDGTAASVGKVIDFLDVEKSARYAPTKTSTYCNIYAYDYARAMGCYLPRVWWKNDKESDVIKYGETVRELSANELYDWFQKFGAEYGWHAITSMTEAQKYANDGKCVICVAANNNAKSSGHITAVVPETSAHKAVKSGGITGKETVVYPLQSNAGRTNKKYFASKWWNNHKTPLFFVNL